MNEAKMGGLDNNTLHSLLSIQRGTLPYFGFVIVIDMKIVSLLYCLRSAGLQ